MLFGPNPKIHVLDVIEDTLIKEEQINGDRRCVQMAILRDQYLAMPDFENFANGIKN